MEAVADVEPAGQAYPALQFPEQAAVVRPVVAPYLPALHGPEHTDDVNAVAMPYCPAGQLVHVAAPAPLYCPVGHTKAVADVDGEGQECPAVQAPVQVATAMGAVAPNHPAGQSMHNDAPARLYRPRAHRVAVGDTDPAGQEYPAVQLPEQAAVVSPATAP
jgi:hypothetical protein